MICFVDRGGLYMHFLQFMVLASIGKYVIRGSIHLVSKERAMATADKSS